MKKILIIFCLLLISSANAQIRNSYGTISGGMKAISGSVVTDLAGDTAGVLAGTSPSAPVVSANGYVTFAGGATAGDRGRIEIPTRTNFDYLYNQSYSYVVIFKSSKNDAAVHTLLSNTSTGGLINSFSNYLSATETASVFYNSTTGQTKNYHLNANKCDGQWHVMVITYSTNAFTYTLDGGLTVTKTTDNAITSGAFYTTANKATIGANYAVATTNYLAGLAGSIAVVQNYSSVLTAGNIADINNEFNILY